MREDLSVHVYCGLVLSFGSAGATLPVSINRWQQEISQDARRRLSSADGFLELKGPFYNHSENLRTLRRLFAYLKGHFQPIERVICETGRVDGD